MLWDCGMQYIEEGPALTLIAAGAVRKVEVVGQPGGWAVVLVSASSEIALRTQRGHVRLFRRLDSAALWLRAAGIATFSVDSRNYAPDSIS